MNEDIRRIGPGARMSEAVCFNGIIWLAGQVGTVGHVTIADDVTVLGKGGITKDIREAGVYAGMPLKPARLWRKAMAKLYAGLS